MVHNNKLIAVVRVNGKILREDHKDGISTVTLPFGSEYEIEIKNQNSRKALIDIDVDGQAVIHELVVDGNKSTVVERFYDGNNSGGNRLKFIDKTAKIVEHRGDKIDDGTLRISWQFEKEIAITKTVTTIHEDIYRRRRYDWWHTVSPYSQSSTRFASQKVSSNDDSGLCPSSHPSSFMASSAPASDDTQAAMPTEAMLRSIQCSVKFDNTPKAEEGITVKGSRSNQQFTYTTIGELEEVTHVVVFRLQGITATTQQVVQTPITTREKIECETCGTKNKSSNKFCSDCGTALR